MPLEKSDFEALARRLAMNWQIHPDAFADPSHGVMFSHDTYLGGMTTFVTNDERSSGFGVQVLIASLREAGQTFVVDVQVDGFHVFRDLNSMEIEDSSIQYYPTLSEAIVRFINSLSIVLPVPTQ